MKTKIFAILKKELRETFRDKKSLCMMLVIPIMIPLLIIGMSFLFESQVNKKVEEYNKIGITYELTDVEKKIMQELNIEPVFDNLKNIEEKYDNEEIDLYLTKEDNKYIIHGDNNDTTSFATMLVESYLNSYKEYLQSEYLATHDINPEDVTDIITYEEDISEEENYFANYITVYAFLFIIMAITISATYPATDATAGEKERGTLETLLTFPIKTSDIILGKYLCVSISSVITGLLSLILTLVSLKIANGFELYKGVNLMLPASGIIFAVIVIIAYSLLISGLCIAIASKSKTFKEAQSALTPLTFISFFPSMIAFMMNIKTTAVLSLVPFLNFTLLFTDITNGTINWIYIALMFISTIVFMIIVMYIIIKQYNKEKILFS